jgi:proteasome lid subunit RPN8/RPN11
MRNTWTQAEAEGFVDRSPEQLVDGFLQETLAGALIELDAQARGMGDDQAVERTYTRVRELRRLRRAVESLAHGVTADTGGAVYLASASFLAEAFRTVTPTPDEHLVYATGPEDGKRLFALTRLVTFELAERGIAHAAPDPASQIAALTELDRSEERLLATFHSHPGKGPGATTPSSVDLSTQAGLEKMGYPTIGAIFCRDGFVRFFSVNRRFRVVVSGAGIEQLEAHLFHLTEVAEKSLRHKGGKP